jgi:hypothetical protein
MARSRLLFQPRDAALGYHNRAQALLYQPGTQTLVTGVWSARTGGNALNTAAAPIPLDSEGYLDVWLEVSQTVDIAVSPSQTAFPSGVAFVPYTVPNVPAYDDPEDQGAGISTTGTSILFTWGTAPAIGLYPARLPVVESLTLIGFWLMANTAPAGNFQVRILKNGVTELVVLTMSSGQHSANISGSFGALVAGDYLQLEVLAANGADGATAMVQLQR